MKLKKLLSLVLTFAMLLSICIISVPATQTDFPFTDVEDFRWFYSAVKHVYDMELMNGVSATTFDPNGSLTRGMFVTILGRLAGAEADESKNTFPDVPAGKWYTGYVGWAFSTGVVTGYSDGTFKPDNNITRQEMAVAMVRFINYADVNMPRANDVPYVFEDSDEIGKWAKDHVETLRRAGIVKGDTSGYYHPQNNITRAETATIMVNLMTAIDNAYQGYLPRLADDGYAVFGAKYLYWNGTIVQGGLGTELDEDSFDYPVLAAFPDEYAAWRTYDQANTVGISASVAEMDFTKTTVVKICYSYENEVDVSLTGKFNVNAPGSESYGSKVYASVDFTTVPGEDEEGFKTATVDITSIVEAVAETNSNVDYTNDLAHILFTPAEEGGTFYIRYIAVVENEDAAENYTAADYESYLKDYYIYSELNFKEFTPEIESYYDTLTAQRIAEILSTGNTVDPVEYKKENPNATIYYVSSINGKKGNDGLSPETAMSNPSELIVVNKVGGRRHLVKPGDLVLFERGSEFYPELYQAQSVQVLDTFDAQNRELHQLYPDATGVKTVYSTYGEGAKPVFRCAVDLRADGDVGRWTEVEENIWVLENKFDTIREDFNERFSASNIFFNDGEYCGVMIKTQGGEIRDKSPFGNGYKTIDNGHIGTGMGIVRVDGGELNSISDAIDENLEFFHDAYENKLYLYFDKGNPADYFDNIRIARNGSCGTIRENCLADNLAFLSSDAYASTCSLLGGVIQNCELGFVGGGYSSVGSGVETGGKKVSQFIDYYGDHVLYNNYIHDIEDGPMSAQNCRSNPGEEPRAIKNIKYIDNVIVACGNGVEIFAGNENNLDEEGKMYDVMENISVTGNIQAYIGYGITQQDGDSGYETLENGMFKGFPKELLCGSMYGELVPGTCVYENNISYRTATQIVSQYMETDLQPRGWSMRGNVYAQSTVSGLIRNGYETYNVINHKRNKRARMATPYNERYLTWTTSIGMEPDGTYYWYTEGSLPHENNEYFMTGYHIAAK